MRLMIEMRLEGSGNSRLGRGNSAESEKGSGEEGGRACEVRYDHWPRHR